ncbi:hypothetical protein GCM10010307_42560 [Streptomyces vastus]|uniref:Uncharacterized protein n=1 Tax=Streptomyces vastus TaxID=285451 RepID=A0ABP6DCD4_9ACTN
MDPWVWKPLWYRKRSRYYSGLGPSGGRRDLHGLGAFRKTRPMSTPSNLLTATIDTAVTTKAEKAAQHRAAQRRPTPSSAKYISTLSVVGVRGYGEMSPSW